MGSDPGVPKITWFDSFFDTVLDEKDWGSRSEKGNFVGSYDR